MIFYAVYFYRFQYMFEDWLNVLNTYTQKTPKYSVYDWFIPTWVSCLGGGKVT